jgi:hypothetical protein
MEAEWAAYGMWVETAPELRAQVAAMWATRVVPVVWRILPVQRLEKDVPGQCMTAKAVTVEKAAREKAALEKPAVVPAKVQVAESAAAAMELVKGTYWGEERDVSPPPPPCPSAARPCIASSLPSSCASQAVVRGVEKTLTVRTWAVRA